MSRTIAAISTAGYGAIGVIKISGNRSKKILEELFKNAGKQRIESDKWQNKRLYYGTIEQDNRVLDEVMAVYMKAPHTYTREDVVEIYTHGNAVCQRRILDAVIDEGAELAEPGEFTKLAFLNGRIDLTQAEAIIEMINAKSEEAFDLALQGLAGQNERSIGNARVRLQEILVEMAVNIDYPDEDIEEINYQKTIESIEDVINELDEVIDITRKRRVYRDGIRVAILGKPNAGKSSLLNELLMEDRAIISDIEGTTRDVIEEQILLSGIPIMLIDTAGIRESDNVIEKEGIDTIYYEAFAGCINLEEVKLPNSLSSIDSKSFKDTKWQNNINADEEGCKYYKDILIEANKNFKEFKLKEGIRIIASGVFEDSEMLERITLPNSIEYIGSTTFKNCKMLSD